MSAYTTEKNFISWSFDIAQNPVIYGYTLWSAHFDHENSNLSFCNLVDCDSGAIALSDVLELIKSKPVSTVVLEKTPETLALKESLYLSDTHIDLELVERLGTELEQITKYSLMFERKLFYLNDFRVVPDLIFDDFTSRNIIDPIVTDEQNTFPLTQALLIACHYAESQNFVFWW